MKYFLIIIQILIVTACSKQDIASSQVTNPLFGPLIQGIQGDPILIQNFIDFCEELDENDSDGYVFLQTDGSGMVNSDLQSDFMTSLTLNSVNVQSIPFNQPSSPNNYFQNIFNGTIVNVTVSNNSSVVTNPIYFPQSFQINPPQSNISTISKLSGLELQWSVDVNPLNDKGVLIEFIYDFELHKSLDSTLTGSRIEERYIVSDNGSFFISPSILSNFPNCRWFQIRLTKGNFFNFIIEGKNLPFAYKEERQIVLELIN